MKAWLLTAVMLHAFGAAAAEPEKDRTVALDLERYLGTWYELARYDHFFERGCQGVTATYEKVEGSEDLKVTNRCVKGGLTGEVKKVEGKAWVPDAAEPGKLKVQFFWPFRADYWVFEVADDYSWALVGDPDRKSCWILSRTPSLPEDVYDGLLSKLKERGFDPEKLLKVEQRVE